MPRVQPEGKDRISIHALLTEGDEGAQTMDEFNKRFQSTPSSRRATLASLTIAQAILISIHALLTEGDSNFAQNISINFSIYMLHLYDFTFYGI